MVSPTTVSPSDWDDIAWLRAVAVVVVLGIIIGLWLICKLCRSSTHTRVRRYDLLSAKELFPHLAADSDSESELYSSDRQQLMRETEKTPDVEDGTVDGANR